MSLHRLLNAITDAVWRVAPERVAEAVDRRVGRFYTWVTLAPWR